MGAADIDRLEVEVEASAVKANRALDAIVGKLERLSSSISKVNGSDLTGFANGIEKICKASAGMSDIKTADFTRLSKNIEKIASINTGSMNATSSALGMMAKQLSSFGTASANASAIGEIAKNISKLGNKGVVSAIDNMPRFATALSNMMTTLSNAPQMSSNLIQMTNALANLASNIKGTRAASSNTRKATGKFSKIFDAITASTNRSSKSFKSFSQIAGSFYANSFMVMRALRKAWSATEASMDFLETVNYFEVAMRKLGDDAAANWQRAGYDSAESYASSFSSRAKQLTAKMTGFDIDANGNVTYTGQKNLGMNPDTVMNYQAMFAQVSESIGVAEESALNFSTALTMLGTDWASLRNTTFEQAFEKFASALAGQSRAVRAFGIDITNATLQEYAYKYGLTEAISEMNQATKAQLRLLAILDQSKVAYGDLANTMESPANQLRMLRQNFSNLARTIGNLFLPIIEKVLPYINGLVMAMQRLFAWVGGLLGINLSGINSSIGGASNGIEDLVGGADDAEDALNGANSAANKLKNTVLGFDELNQLNDPTSGSNGKSNSSNNSGTGGGNPLLDEEIANALTDYQKAWDEAFDRMENKAQKIADKICKAFKKGDYKSIGTYVSNGISSALEGINWKSVYKVANAFGTGLAKFLNGLITPRLFGNVGKTIAGSLNTALTFLNSFGTTFDWKNFGNSIATGINNFFKTFNFVAAADTINVWVCGIFDMLTTAVEGVDWKKIGQSIADFVQGIDWGKLTWNLVKLVSALADALADAIIGFTETDPLGASIVAMIGAAKLTGLDTTIITSISKFMTGKTIPITSKVNVSIGTAVIASVATWEIGFGAGKEIGKALFPDDAEYYDNFHWFGEGGFFEELIGSIEDGTAKDAFKKMWNDIIVEPWQDVWNILADTQLGKILHLKKIEDKYGGKGKKFTAPIETDKKETKKAATSLYAGVVEEFSKLPDIKTTITSDSVKDAGNMKSKTQNELNKLTPFNSTLINNGQKDGLGIFNRTQKGISTLAPFNSEIGNNSTKDAGNMKSKTQNELNKLTPFNSTISNNSQTDGMNMFNKTQNVFARNVFHTSAKSDTSGHSIWSTIQSAFSLNALHTTAKSDTSGETIRNSLQNTFGLKSLITAASLSVSGDKLREGLQTDFGKHALSTSVSIPDGWAAFSSSWEKSKETLSAGIEMDVQAKADGKFLVPNSLTSVLIKGFASGGYPTSGQLFMARENGINEMVGQIGNRHAVANNDQIVESIQGGVETAMMNVMMAFAGHGTSNSTSEPVIENVLKVDSETWYRITQKAVEQHDNRYHTVTAF